MKKIAIVGSKNFFRYSLMKWFITLWIVPEEISLVVSGGAEGADTLGERFAEEHGIEKLIFLPEWERYGKAAGPIRNTSIIKNSDVVFAFHDGISRGTQDDINKANQFRKDLHICNFTEVQYAGKDF